MEKIAVQDITQNTKTTFKTERYYAFFNHGTIKWFQNWLYLAKKFNTNNEEKQYF